MKYAHSCMHISVMWTTGLMWNPYMCLLTRTGSWVKLQNLYIIRSWLVGFPSASAPLLLRQFLVPCMFTVIGFLIMVFSWHWEFQLFCGLRGDDHVCLSDVLAECSRNLWVETLKSNAVYSTPTVGLLFDTELNSSLICPIIVCSNEKY